MNKRIVRVLAGGLGIGLLIGGAGVGALLWHIHRTVERCKAIAQQHHPHPGDDVAALIEFMNSDSHTLRERNLAVWALGRLADPRALPALQSVYTGGPCQHDKQLCQHELAKAIRRCGDTPLPASAP